MFTKARLEEVVELIDKTIDFLNQKHVRFIKGRFCEFLDGRKQTPTVELHLEKGRECAVCLRGAFYSVCPTTEFFKNYHLGLDCHSYNNILTYYFQQVFNSSIVAFNDEYCNSKDDQISALNKVKDAILADIAKL